MGCAKGRSGHKLAKTFLSANSMRVKFLPLLTCCLVLVSGCADRLRTAATTYVRPVPGEKGKAQPVCFMPPPEGRSLADDAANRTFLDICARAAVAEGMSVVPYGTSGCLTVEHRAEDVPTGDRQTDLSCGYMSCTGVSRELRQKSLHLVLRQPGENKPVAELHAAHLSTRPSLSMRGVYALCATAFRDYPADLRSKQYSIRLPRDL